LNQIYKIIKESAKPTVLVTASAYPVTASAKASATLKATVPAPVIRSVMATGSVIRSATVKPSGLPSAMSWAISSVKPPH